MRCLLIEEEIEISPHFGSSGTGKSLDGVNAEPYSNIALSLAMDAAQSAVASSTLCRGCGCSGNKNIPVDIHNNVTGDAAIGINGQKRCEDCQCCKVVFLIPSTDFQRQYNATKSRKKRKRRQNSNGTKAMFPMSCCRDRTNDSRAYENSIEKWDQRYLNNIQIKYVNSLADVIRYLVYAPSLPEHLQPLDGIFLVGIGSLLSRETDVQKLELTHVCKLSRTRSARFILMNQFNNPKPILTMTLPRLL